MEIQFVAHYIVIYILLILVAVAFGIYAYRQSFPPLKKYERILLAGLRSAMLLLLGVFLVEPVLNFYSSKKINPQLAVLMDVSRSMGIKDDSTSRIARAEQLTEKALGEIKDGYRIIEFATDIKEADGFPGESDLSGDATSIANALREFSERKDIDNFGAVMIVSDGRQNLGEDPVEVADKLDMPIYTLTIGKQTVEKNLAIENVIFPAVAFSGADFRVETEVSAVGLPAGKSRLIMKLGSNVVIDKPFDIPQEGRTVKVGFDIKAPQPGNYEYTISTPILDGESNKVDNERIFAVRVLKNKLMIFVGSSTLNWEFKFFRQALSKFAEFDLDAVYPEGAGRFSKPGTPRGLDGLKQYDVVIIINSSPQALRIAPAELAKYVNEGGSLIYLAGRNGPLDIQQFDDLLPVKSISPRLVESEFYFEPSPLSKQHAAILMDDNPDQSVRLWRSLPPFRDLVTGIEATGEVLLEAGLSAKDSLSRPFGQESQMRPVLTVGRHGKGRVAVITGFPWWQSYFSAVRDPRSANVIPNFWRNLVKWSSATDQTQNFRIMTERKVYRLGEPIQFTGYLFDEASRPKGGAYVSLSIFPERQETKIKDIVLPPVDNGIYAEKISSLAPGHYNYKAYATSYGDTLGRTDGDITIEKFSLEMASSSPDYNLPRRIAEATGGTAYTADDFAKFPEQLKLAPYVKESHASIRPFGLPVLLVILLAGLCLEWGLRKRFRLP